MSIAIVIKPGDLGKSLSKEGERLRKIMQLAAKAAANKLKAYLVHQVDALGITYQGIYKGSFRVVGTRVENNAPHAGIIELGARPHKVSKEGREAIKRWAMLKLGLSDKDAEEASWGISKNIEKYGQRGHYVMRDAVPMALTFYKQELTRLIQNAKGKPA